MGDVQTVPPVVVPVPVKRCLDCGYVIDGLEATQCPECGRAFDPADPSTYTTKPPLVLWKLWLPGAATAVISGVLVTLFIDFFLGARGYGLWIGVPFAVAAIAGYRLKHASAVLWMVVMIICFGGLLLGLVTMGAAGVFCVIILFMIFGAPIIAGGITGLILRLILKRAGYEQAEHLPVVALLAIPVLASLVEGRAQPGPVEAVRTTAVIPAPLDDAWGAMMYYEEVVHDPPWILRAGLARPTRTLGASEAVGDVKTCLYNKGRLTKEVAHVEPHRHLEFRIIEQEIGYEKDVALRGGRFEFEALDEQYTRLTLVTEYQPLLTPRFAWRPGERYAIRTLHEHVIEGMRREAMTVSEQDRVAIAGETDEVDRR